MIRNLLLIVVVIFFLSACKNEDVSNKGEGKDTLEANIDETLQVKLQEFEDFAKENVGETVKIKGTVTHVCHHSMNKMYLMDENSEYTVKVDAGEMITQFDTLLEGKVVMVKGIVNELVIDSAYLAEWEAEIDAEISEDMNNDENAEDAEESVHEHHGDPKEQIESYRTQIEKRGEALRFYSLEAESVETVE